MGGVTSVTFVLSMFKKTYKHHKKTYIYRLSQETTVTERVFVVKEDFKRNIKGNARGNLNGNVIGNVIGNIKEN